MAIGSLVRGQMALKGEHFNVFMQGLFRGTVSIKPAQISSLGWDDSNHQGAT